ncbi:MAG: hypothetical protein O7H41_16140 [Planctomycetota bacterium]|nr:hypothetical protein [Planctomycetota bacterium]
MEPTIVKSLQSGIRKVMKPQQKGDEISCAYLYADALIAVRYQRPDGIPGSYRHIDYWQTLATTLRPAGKGRVVLQDYGILWALPMSSRIEWKGPSLSAGSENTRKMGMSVGHMSIKLNRGNGISGSYQNAINLYEMSGIALGITIQEETPRFDVNAATDDPIAVHYVVQD